MYKLIIAEWQALVSIFLALILIKLAFLKVKRSREDYKVMLTNEYLSIEKEYKSLVAAEGVIYDRQLKYNQKLNEISSLYEIIKDMSTSLRFADIFKVLAEYLQKNFVFKKAALILMERGIEASPGDIVYETKGLEDTTIKTKGIFPKLEISSRPYSEHDKKIYNLLKNDVKNLQITKTKWENNPYIEYLPNDAQTYMAVPMIIENELIGILVIENLPASDLEKFTILAAQFALEMRRIILYEKVEEMAITDGLTKAFAKRHIMERLGEEFERSIRHDFNLSFLMVDIDHFKNYNDTYGHLVGDAVLKDIVNLLKGNTREVDLVGRFGGEEFCVILPETGQGEAQLVAERIRYIIEKHKFKAYDELTDVTVSIGMASYPDDAKSMDALIENSDKALYRAKNEGRNRVSLYNS